MKELRLRGIDDMEAANASAGVHYNRRFAVAPREPRDAHREVPHDDAELDLIHCRTPPQASKNSPSATPGASISLWDQATGCGAPV